MDNCIVFSCAQPHTHLELPGLRCNEHNTHWRKLIFSAVLQGKNEEKTHYKIQIVESRINGNINHFEYSNEIVFVLKSMLFYLHIISHAL